MLTACVLCLGVVAELKAQETKGTGDLEKENAELRRRVGKLEKDLAEIKALLLQQGIGNKPAVAPAPKTAPPQFTPEEVAKLKNAIGQQSPASAAAFTPDEVKQLKRVASPGKMPVLSSLAVELYGYVKLDASYDTSATAIGEYGRWVQSEATNRNDNQFSMTARQTRLGMNIYGPDVAGARTSGKIEVDFYRGDGENHNMPRMRHAYLKLDWPEHRFSILAGQTWDVISPLYSPTINFTVGWWQGNIGHRRPQIRLTKGFELAKDTELKLELAAVRTITNRTTLFTPANEDTGEDAGFPTIQSRASLTFPFIPGAKPATVGVSGHWGEEESDRDARGHNRNYVTWSGNVDMKVPVTNWLTLQSEGFVGENLDAYLGGIGQGLNTTRGREVRAQGGWVAASLGPWAKWTFNLGAGIDNPSDGDLTAGSRTCNRVVFGNAWYAINKSASVGLELSQLHTNYKQQRDSGSLRAHLAFLYKF